MQNPFDIPDSLVNISSGKVAPDDVSKEMTSAKEIGNKNIKVYEVGYPAWLVCLKFWYIKDVKSSN